MCPTQGLNPGLSHCRQILYHLSHWESPLQEKDVVKWEPVTKIPGLDNKIGNEISEVWSIRSGVSWRGNLVEGEEVLAWITFQLEGPACTKILWQKGAWCTHKTNMEHWTWGEAWPAWRGKQTLGRVKNAVFTFPKMGKELTCRSCHCNWDMGKCFPKRYTFQFL